MQSKYIIFSSESEAININKVVTNLCFSNGHWTDGGFTNNYTNPIKHPTQNKWAVIIEKGYEKYFTQSENDGAVSLSEDWKPEIEMLK